jgi:tetratricopeptide (TPR) repeat protein
MTITQYNDPLLPVWYTDGAGNKISIEITNDYYKIVNNKIWLAGIPSDYFKINTIQIDSTVLYEAKQGSIINTNNFTVDYNLGIITVDESYNGKTALVQSWKSRGALFFPANRVYDVVNGTIANGEFIGKTLQDYINEIQKYVYQGEYDSINTYYQNQIVYYNGSTYICINDNNGVGVSGIIPNNLLYWRVLAAGYQYRGEYDNSIVYYNRDIITHNNSTYLCISQISQGNHPTNNSYWKLISAGFNYLGDYNNTIQYYPRDVVSYAGNTYVCVVSNIGEIPFNSGKWSLFAQRGENFFYYDSGVEITHNLNTYNVMVLAVTENTYGHGGYGNFGMGNYLQLETMIEYVNTNTIRLHFSESFLGTPTLTTLISGQSYRIDFSEEATPVFVYLK